MAAMGKEPIRYADSLPERIITPEQASRLFRRGLTYRVEVFET